MHPADADNATPRCAAILLAGGSGDRMAGSVADKILVPLAGKPVIAHSLDAIRASGAAQRIVVVCRDDDQRRAIEDALGQDSDNASLAFVRGGSERQDSVWNGLQALPDDTEIALIHDGARPCADPQAIRQAVAQAHSIGAACLARRVTDTLKSADPYDGAFLPTTVERAKLWAMETPQCFRFPLIREAYQAVIRSGARITDDLAAIENLDQPVAFVENPLPNPKLTTPADLPYLEFLLARQPS